MSKQLHAVGERVEMFCPTCEVERGHVVSSVTKRGHVSRVTCPKCETRSSFKAGAGARADDKSAAPYDRTRTYCAGQALVHPTFGPGEVTAVIEPHKIDVLFSDRMRRLIHSQS